MEYRVGVAGLRQAAGLINLFESYPNTKVTAICDIDEVLLNEVGQQHGIEQRFTDYAAFVQADIDIVELSTPIQVHCQQAIDAMKHGKHVLSQYIAATDKAEADELLHVALDSGKKYMFIETDCYEKRNRVMVALARQGVLGELTWGRGEYIHDCKSLGYKSDGSYTWRGQLWKKGLGGIAAGVHTCMPLLQVFDERVETLCAMGPGVRMLPEFGWNDTVIALCKFPSGRMIQLQIDIFSYRPARCGYFLQGTRGCFEYNRATMVTEGPLSDWKSLDQLAEEYELADIMPDSKGHHSAFALCIKDFMTAIDNNTRPPLDLSDSLHVTAIGWAIDESLQTGSTVEVVSFDNP